MRITFLGQAGLFIETRQGTILCDPWFNPAYFASWFPFPDNSTIDPETIGNPDYLYVSHLHHDHYDPQFLRQHVSKDTTVLLPDYPLDLLRRDLEELGFTKFIQSKANEPFEASGLRLMIMPLVAPTDGPIGDSGLAVDDGEVRIFNQNDSRPIELEYLNAFAPLDAHFLQFSGAIWFPMVYNFHPKAKLAYGRKKRKTELARALRYVQEVGASFIFPSAGPPCFLDDDLFDFNDFDRDPANTFPDQTVFIEYLQENGYDSGRLVIPGSVITLEPGRCEVTHPFPEDEVRDIFNEKRAYLEAYQARVRPLIEAERASWPRGQVEILPALQEWFEPLLEEADLTCSGINGRVLLDCGEQIVIDFLERRVYAWQGEQCRYRFGIDRSLVEHCILHHEEDWVNELFLACRFEAEREGPYNEYVYNFFKSLSEERLQYTEGYYTEQAPVQELWQCGDYLIQKRCPHLKADLSRFAEVDSKGILTCTMHGWQFDIATGRCLTSDDRRLFTKPVSEVENDSMAEPA